MRTEEILCKNLKNTYLNSYFERDQKHPMNLKYDGIQDFKGVSEIRNKREKKYLIFIPILIILMIIFVVKSTYENFSLNRFWYPQDFRGDYCGKKNLKDKPYLYWPASLEWGFNVKTCLEECPEKSRQEICLYNPQNDFFYEDYCFLTTPSIKKGFYCFPKHTRQIQHIFLNLNSGILLIIRLAKDFYWIVEIFCFLFFFTTLFNIFNSIMISQIRYGINKIYFCFILVLIILFNILNIIFSKRFYNQLQSDCQDFDEYCKNKFFIFSQIIFYLLIIFPSLKAIKFIINIKKNWSVFEFIPNFNYFMMNKYTVISIIFFHFIKLIFLSITLIILFLQISSGSNENVATGDLFYVREVRDTTYKWYNWIGLSLVFLFLLFGLKFFSICEKYVLYLNFSQWYFNTTKLWIRGLFKISLKNLFRNLSSICFYVIILTFLDPIRMILEKLKRYLDSIEIAQKRHLFLIKLVKPLIYIYEYFFKYYSKESLIDVAIFGNDFKNAGIRIYYLKLRNWETYNLYDNTGKIYSDFMNYLLFSLNYFFTLTYIYFVGKSFLHQIKYNENIEFIFYYPFFLSLFFCLFFNIGTKSLSLGLDSVLFCYAADMEMFQLTQRFTEKKLIDFMGEKLQNKVNLTKNKKTKKKNEEGSEKEEIIQKKKVRKGFKLELPILNSEGDNLKNENKLDDGEDIKNSLKKKNIIGQEEFKLNKINLKDYIQKKKNQANIEALKQIQKDFKNSELKVEGFASKKKQDDFVINPNSFASSYINKLKKKPIEKKDNKKIIVFDDED